MSGKYTGAITSNDLSTSLNRRIKLNQPSLRLISKWYQEWLEQGLDKRITFQNYRKEKYKQYYSVKRKN